jgi:hypothetical protein
MQEQEQMQPLEEVAMQVAADVSAEQLEIEMQREAQEQNARNEQCAPGNGGGAMPEFLSPAQVRAMDRREVKDNYALIIESMKHWQ